MKRFIGILCCIAVTLQLSGQDLVYTPKNPAFGGNFLNYNWLLNSANAQNTLEAPSESSDDILEDFDSNFNQQILNEISRELLRSNELFGEGGLQEGSFEFGNFQLNVVPGVNGLVITINDLSTGAQTQITVPYD